MPSTDETASTTSPVSVLGGLRFGRTLLVTMFDSLDARGGRRLETEERAGPPEF